MKRISKSVFLITVVLALAGYQTYAYCTSDNGPFKDTFGSKKLDLEIDFSGYYNKAVDGHPNAGKWSMRDLTYQKFFDFDDIKPGDSGEGTISLHVKNKNAWACAIVKPTKNDDRSSTEPELAVDQSDLPGNQWDGELAQNLNFRIWADICAVRPAKPGNNKYEANCDRLLMSGTGPLTTLKWPLADSQNSNVFTGQNGPLQKDKNYYIGVDWQVPAGTGNSIQTDTYKADITFFARQADENARFKCADINDDRPELCRDGATQSCYTGPAGTQGVGLCRGGTEMCSRGEWGKCQEQVLPEKEICGDAVDNDCDGQTNEGCPPPPKCTRNNQCDDKVSGTEDKCEKGKCVHKPKHNYWDDHNYFHS